MEPNESYRPPDEPPPSGGPDPIPTPPEPNRVMIFDAPAAAPERAQPSAAAGQPLRQILGKAVVSISNGQRLGSVQDVLIDPQGCKVAALTLTRGGLFNREILVVPVADVQAWGLHAIMVDRPDVAVRRDRLPDQARWVSAAEQIQGRPVLTLEGTKIGQVTDMEIDASGQVAAYHLAAGGDDPNARNTQRIPARLTRSIGQDVIIVDLRQGETPEQV